MESIVTHQAAEDIIHTNIITMGISITKKAINAALGFSVQEASSVLAVFSVADDPSILFRKEL